MVKRDVVQVAYLLLFPRIYILSILVKNLSPNYNIASLEKMVSFTVLCLWCGFWAPASALPGFGWVSVVQGSPIPKLRFLSRGLITFCTVWAVLGVADDTSKQKSWVLLCLETTFLFDFFYYLLVVCLRPDTGDKYTTCVCSLPTTSLSCEFP